MPRLKPIVSEVQTPGPLQSRELSIDAEQAPGEGLSRLGRGAEEASGILERRAQQADVSDLHAKMSQAHADFTNNLNQTLRTADPSDRNLADNFMKGYDDYMGKVSDGINTASGRNYFNKMSAELRAHFLEKATSGQAELEGMKAKQDYSTALNNYSSSLIQDPSSFDSVKQMHADSLKDLVANHDLPEDVALKLQENGDKELAKSAVRGWISLNPQYADQQLKSGRFDQYMDGDLKHQLLGEVVQAQHASDAEQERQARKQKDLLGQAQNATQNQFLQKLTTGDLTNKDILNSNLDPFGSGSKEQFIKLVQANGNDKLKTDPSTFKTLFDRIHLPDGDPNKIVDENDLNQYVTKGQLSFDDLNRLRQETQGKRTEEGSNESLLKNNIINAAKASLLKPDKLTGLPDPQGAQQYQAFLSNFLDTWDKDRKAGISVRDLTDPSSKNYLGNTINSFKRSPEDIIKSMVNQPQSSSPNTSAAIVSPQSQGDQGTPPAQGSSTSGSSNAVQDPTAALLSNSGSPQSSSQPSSSSSSAPQTSAPAAPAAPPAPVDESMRKPGETIVEWRERTKGL